MRLARAVTKPARAVMRLARTRASFMTAFTRVASSPAELARSGTKETSTQTRRLCSRVALDAPRLDHVRHGVSQVHARVSHAAVGADSASTVAELARGRSRSARGGVELARDEVSFASACTRLAPVGARLARPRVSASRTRMKNAAPKT